MRGSDSESWVGDYLVKIYQFGPMYHVEVILGSKTLYHQARVTKEQCKEEAKAFLDLLKRGEKR